MNNKLKISIAILMTLVALTAYANKPVRTWNTPAKAAQMDENVSNALDAALDRGYVVFNETENMYNYLVAPSGSYLYGECVIVLRAHDYNGVTNTNRMTIRAYIQYEENGKFRCVGYDVQEWASY